MIARRSLCPEKLESNPGQGSEGINFSGWHGLDMSIRASLLFFMFLIQIGEKNRVGRSAKYKKTINKKLAMDDALQIHINIIFVCNTTTADVPTLYALVCALSVLKNKD